jgi:hypothetical protein
MLFPLWLENIVLAAQQWVSSRVSPERVRALLMAALAATGALTLSAACGRTVTSIGW